MTEKHLIITGSPRTVGRCSQLASQLYTQILQEDPTAIIAAFCLCNRRVLPCVACDSCKNSFTCILDDDMQLLYELLDVADSVHVISPVYFAGPPAQLKAVFDRMQPYYWERVREQPKRFAQLYVVGEGGDPHGFEPLVGITRSALASAGFALEEVLDLVGQLPDPNEMGSDSSGADFVAATAGVEGGFSVLDSREEDAWDVEPEQAPGADWDSERYDKLDGLGRKAGTERGGFDWDAEEDDE